MASPSLRLADPDFLAQAKQRLSSSGVLSGQDQDYFYAVLDAGRFDMTIVRCEPSLTGAIARLARPPATVINAQFMRRAGSGFSPEGEVVRGAQRIHKDSRMKRWYLAQFDEPADARAFVIGEGNPWSRQRRARVAVGGLGPVLKDGRHVPNPSPWVQSTYARSAGTGRGILAIDRSRGLLLLLVQRQCFWCDNATTMTGLRDWLQSWGVNDAVFNDGSDSEALFAEGRWLLEPGWLKDRAMDFAIGFVDRESSRRTSILAFDGTPTQDAQTFVRGVQHSPLLHYAPRVLAEPVGKRKGALRRVVRDGVIETHRTSSRAAGRATERVVEFGGVRRAWTDVLYISSHATRHGVLYYQHRDSHRAPLRRFADPWSSSFRPVWRKNPLWLILAGCAVLALRYSRLRGLSRRERSGLLDRHRDIHGAKARILGLTDDKEAIFQVYHPGWRWYSKVFRDSSLRGVLGYWYRSPGGKAGDLEILQAFVDQLNEGEPLLEAWREANQRGWLGAAAAWAAMVREGCEDDTLATLEDASTGPIDKAFRYFDDHVGDGRPLAAAYQLANQHNAAEKIEGGELRYHKDYDRFALNADRRQLPLTLTWENLLIYNDDVGP